MIIAFSQPTFFLHLHQKNYFKHFSHTRWFCRYIKEDCDSWCVFGRMAWSRSIRRRKLISLWVDIIVSEWKMIEVEESFEFATSETCFYRFCCEFSIIIIGWDQKVWEWKTSRTSPASSHRQIRIGPAEKFRTCLGDKSPHNCRRNLQNSLWHGTFLHKIDKKRSHSDEAQLSFVDETFWHLQITSSIL